MEICNHDLCTGCFACISVCPKNAIEKRIDEIGNEIPNINEDKCVSCGLCQKVCPNNQTVESNYPRECYAAWSKEKDDLLTCSSGGIATTIGRYVIEKCNGVVFGATFTEHLELEMKMATNKEELNLFKTSKYAHADTKDTFQKVKDQLIEGRMVLYVGTPCQIAGLKCFLHKDYENLVLIDIICHGTPPLQYLKEHAKFVSKNCDVSKATFRGEKDYALRLYNEDNKLVYEKDAYEDFYFRAFQCSMISRESCYSCQFAKTERVSDITIGDFWELDKSTLKEKYDGKVSVVLLNSEQGQKFYESIKDLVICEKRSIEEALKGNEQLKKPATKYSERKLFLSLYPEFGFEKAIRKTALKQEIVKLKRKRLRWKITGNIKSFLHKK